MATCAHCGSDNLEASRFCGGCGRPLAAPRAVGTTGPASPTLPSIDWRRLLAGSWWGAGATALTALAVAGVLSLVLGLLARPVDFGVDNGLALVATLLAASFGADLVLDLDQQGGDAAQAYVGLFPFTVTILALGGAVLVFRRVTARHPRSVDAVLDAVRASLLLGLAVMVVALAFRADNDEMGRGWLSRFTADSLGIHARWGADGAGAFFLSFALLATTLLATVLAARRDWWSAGVQQVHDWTAAPLQGLAVLLALLPLAGLVGYLLMWLTGDTLGDLDPTRGDLSTDVAAVTGLVANAGYWLICLGSGAAAGSTSSETGSEIGAGSRVTADLHHLAHFAHATPGLWAAPAVMLVVLLLAVLTVARRTAAPERVLGNLAVFVALLLVAVPLLSRVTSMHAGLSASAGTDSYHFAFDVGPVGWQATLLLALVAVACALPVALVGGHFRPALVRAQVGALAGRLRSDSGRRSVVPTTPPPAAPPPAPAQASDEAATRGPTEHLEW